jgi:pimeloyl-ACP methyl ester carboxylesterase
MADKTPLVLVPGLLCSPAQWAPQMAGLSDIADITIGDHTRHDTMQAIAQSILAATPQRFALAGLSMGGYIAQQIVLQAPERVARLALLDTGSRADTPERKERRLQLNEMARREGAARVQQELLPLLIHADRLADKTFVDLIVQMATDTGVEAFLRQHAALMARGDNRPLLSGIRCPTLVLVGRQDVLTPLELSEEMAGAIPGARLQVIEDCGHLSTLEQPDAVNHALRAWLTH